MLKLEVVTPQKKVLEVEAEWVNIPGIEGEMGILPQHISIVTTLETGLVTYMGLNGKQSLGVHWGYVQVDGVRVIVLAELAEDSADIDIERAKIAESNAKEKLSQINLSSKDWDSEKKRLDKYEFKLKRSIVRQRLASLK